MFLVLVSGPGSWGQVRDDLKVMGCSAMLDKYDSYSVKVKLPPPHVGVPGSEAGGVCVSQEYLVKEGNLSRGALRMIGDILNENSLFYMSMVEMLYIQSDINDKTE